MRISDWSSDVCSSDLRSSRLASSWRTTSVRLTETTQGPSCRSNPSYVSSISAEPPECLEKHHWKRSRTIRASTRRSEEHTSELQSLMRISYADFCFNKNNSTTHSTDKTTPHPHSHHVNTHPIV